MALFQRYLVLGFSALLLHSPGSLRAQSAVADASGTFRTFCVAVDGRVSKLFYDYQGRQVPIAASNINFSSPHRRPENGIVSLYRQLPPVPPATTPRRVPVKDVVIGSGGPWLVFLTTTNNPADPDRPIVNSLVVDQSWTTHPAGMVRIFNFSRTPIAVQAGAGPVELAPAQSQLVPYPDAKEPFLWLKAAVKSKGEWVMRLNAPQRIVHEGTRATWVLFDRPVTEDSPKPRLMVRNLVDPVPSPISP